MATATNACGSAMPDTAKFTVTVADPCFAQIQSHSPSTRSVTVTAGTNPPISIVANATLPHTFQWYKPGSPVNTGGRPFLIASTKSFELAIKLSAQSSSRMWYAVVMPSR